MNHTPIDTYCGLLLAAGAGLRFRASVLQRHGASAMPDKLLSPLPGSDLVVAQASARALLQAVRHVIAVVPPHSPALAALLRQEGCSVIVNANAQAGMGASLSAGIAAVQAHAARHPAMRGCLVALADMPWIRTDTIRQLCELPDPARPAAPFYQGRRGHPVRFGAAWFDQLAALQGDNGAGALLRQSPPCALPCDDPGVLQDVDTLQALLDHRPQ